MLYWLRELASMNRNVRLPRKSLTELRLSLLKDQLLNAYHNVNYYRDVFDHRGLDPFKLKSLEDLENYPIITRQDIQREGASFLSTKFSAGTLKKSHSSGSTGRPLWSYFDQNTWVRKKYLSKIRARVEGGLKLGERLAIFDSDPPAELALKNGRRMLSNPLVRARYFSIFDENQKNHDELKKWRPTHIDSPPSLLFNLARVSEKTKRDIPSVKRIYTSSEYLELNMRKFIERKFNTRIIDVYGCTEIKEIAWECERHEGYHINDDEVLVEILDGDNPVKPGEVGDIVLTDLRNRAMPLIRYRIGDRGCLLANLCSCCRTFSLMIPTAGRASEHIITPEGKKISPYRLTTAVEKISNILQYQFIQKNNDSIDVNVVMTDRGGEKELLEIHKKTVAVVGFQIKVNVIAKESLDAEKNGKFKVVKSDLSADYGK
jgi:phenylacetate-CoA ligase